MEQTENNLEKTATINGAMISDARLMQLLQVWRDYYDEIFEADLRTGEFVSMMEESVSRWPKSGFSEIEVIILVEKLVHPDDKEAFKEFFDLDSISRRIREGVYVTKLNFRIKLTSGEYTWVKVKNIVPTKQVDDNIKFFACFRRVDDETDADLRYKQELVDALEKQRLLCDEKTALFERVSADIRSPLTAIIGMAALAKTDTSDPHAARERFKMIEQEALKMNRILKYLLNENEKEELPEFEFEDHPINTISYGRRHAEVEQSDVSGVSDAVVIPEDYAYISNIRDVFTPNATDAFVFEGKRVLIAEGNKLNAEVMQDLLTRAKAEFDLAGNGKEAVIKFVSKPAGTYDLILMDTDLQVLDGYSAVKCIRIAGKDDSQTVPVFALTANATPEEIRKSYKAGFTALFTKPFDFTILFEKMKEQMYGIH